MIFGTSDEDDERIRVWLSETVFPQIIAKQRESNPQPSMFMEADWDAGYPYEGASGGGLTYSFTPTSLGLVTKVQYGDFELDLSDYESW